MGPSLINPRGQICLALGLWLAVGLFTGCATMDNVSKELEKGYHALAQEEYYLKRPSKLWSRPDRSSSQRGAAQRGNKVVKLTGDVRGWSKVRVEGSGVEGWLPAACLSKSPVSASKPAPKASQPAAPAPAPAPAAKTPAPAAASPAPAQGKSGSILSPSSAEAAEKPPAKTEPAPQRKADPKKFEPL